MQNRWASLIEPPLSLPIASSVILKSVSLASGSNSINHLLDRTLQGWFVIRQRSSATVYDTQDANLTPDKTLQLTASAAVVVDIQVF